MPSDPSAILGLGRDTGAAVRHFGDIVATLGELPTLTFGTRPRKSPNNAKFWNRRYCAQLAGLGDCTGETLANVCQYLLRLPPDRTAESQPLPRKDLSALYPYWNGRAYGRAKGYNFTEGCVGSFVAFAAKQTGLCSIEHYPPTLANYQGYSDRRKPPQAAFDEGAQHVVVETSIVPSVGAVLDLAGAGFVVMMGAPVTEGFMRTDDTGRFHWLQGREVGGHEFAVLDYDLDEGWIKLATSWANARWGALENHPEQDPRCQGYNNIGWCTIEEFEQVANPRAIANGSVEFVAVNNVRGWGSKLKSFVHALGG